MKNLEIKRLPVLGFACREALNSLCTNLMFAGDNIRTVALTSCHASEGKSFLSLNVARSMAQMGNKVALVDADLRKSVMHRNYEFSFEDGHYRGRGLAHYLAGMAEEDEILYTTNVPHLYIVPSGREIKNPLTLINSPKFEELLGHLAQAMDYVFIDTPPVLLVSDAVQVAKRCDGALMVVGSNEVHRQELCDAVEQLNQNNVNILGTALNMSEADNYMGRKYYHGYYYRNYKYGKYGYGYGYYGSTPENASSKDEDKK